MKNWLEWQQEVVNKLEALPIMELLEETLSQAAGDDYDGNFTEKGSWEFSYARGRLGRRVSALIEEAERLRAELLCDCCHGQAPESGKPCACNGTGSIAQAFQYARDELCKSEARLHLAKRRIAELIAEVELLEGARQDRERLNWLEKHLKTEEGLGRVRCTDEETIEIFNARPPAKIFGSGSSIREAIDAVRKAEKKEQEL